MAHVEASGGVGRTCGCFAGSHSDSRSLSGAVVSGRTELAGTEARADSPVEMVLAVALGAVDTLTGTRTTLTSTLGNGGAQRNTPRARLAAVCGQAGAHVLTPDAALGSQPPLGTVIGPTAHRPQRTASREADGRNQTDRRPVQPRP